MTANREEPPAVNKTRIVLGAVSLAALLALTACGGEDSGGGNDTASATAGSAGETPGRPAAFDTEQLEEISACLEAAGLEDKMPTGRPSGIPSDLPSDLPTDLPTDLPSGLPTDFGAGGPGSGADVLQDREVRAALEACGIDLPQAPQQE